MAVAIHIELDLLCTILLIAIAYQSRLNVDQQMQRILFRNTIYGVIVTLILDILCMLLDGKLFPGSVFLNMVFNALFLSAGVILGCIWFMYVLETLGTRLTRPMTYLIMIPGFFALFLNLVTIRTKWIFYVDEHNYYVRGSFFWIQTILAVGMALVSLFYIVIALFLKKARAPQYVIRELLGFYIIPVIGTLLTLPYANMPGTWNCAAFSIALMYLNEQDREVLKDGLTGLNNRKNLEHVFADYIRQIGPDKRLYMFMIDLDDFKMINDRYGHHEGDQALIAAAGILTSCVARLQALVVRFGGDEFLILGFFPNDQEAGQLKQSLEEHFALYAKEQHLKYHFAASIGYGEYQEGQGLAQLLQHADQWLYIEKRKRKGMAS